MKNLFLFFALLFSANFAFAQEEANPNPTRQFGFDAGGFLARFLNFSGTGNTNTDTYYLTYRKFGGEKNIRLGIGASIAVEGDGNDGTNTSSAIAFRGGSERFQDFGKTMGNTTRWRAFYGLDGKVNLAFTSAGSSDNSSTALELGIAPVFGLQFRINERLSLSTELWYNLFFRFRDSNGQSRFGANTRFDAPTAVYVNYDF